MRRTSGPGSLAALWARPGYPALYAGATLGRLADEMLPVAMVLLILDRTGRPALASAAVAAASFPSVVTGPLLGAYIDRSGRRRAALVANQVVLAASLIAVLALAGAAPAWALLALVLAGGAGAPLLSGGVTSMIPLLVPRPLLPRANAWEAASFNGAAIAGPALAGATAATLGASAAVALEAGVALLALVALVRLPTLGHAAAARGEAGARAVAGEAERGGSPAAAPSLGGALREGLAHLLRSPPLRGVTVASTLALGAQGLLPLALPLLCARLGTGRASAGYVWAALEAGGIAGTFVAVRALAAWPPERVVLAGTAVLAAGTATWALAPSLPVLLALAAAAGLAAGPSFAALFTVRQQASPPHLRAQIFTTAASLKIGAYAIGAALAGPVVGGTGARGAVLLAGVLELVAVAAGLAVMRPGPRPGARR